MSEPIYTAEVICPGCRASVPAAAERCASCGAMVRPVRTVPNKMPPDTAAPYAAATKATVAPPFNPFPLAERRWVVICTMVFAALFLGFPFLWKSRAFSRAGKIFWTVAVLIETVVVFWVFYIAMAWAIGNIRDALQ